VTGAAVIGATVTPVPNANEPCCPAAAAVVAGGSAGAVPKLKLTGLGVDTAGVPRLSVGARVTEVC
jgi:hypothetical protein